MTAYHPSLLRFSEDRTNPILALFGQGRRKRDGDVLRRRMSAIHDFLHRHGLPPEAALVSIAHEVTGGDNPGLARRIRQREQAGDAITPEWLLEAAARQAEESGLGMVQSLLDRIESSLSLFGQASHAARSVTRDYNCALAEHGRELETRAEALPALGELVQLVKVMIERTRIIEQDMAASEARSRQMREDLERARRMSEEDYLTGLPNRRAFDRLLAGEREQAEAHGEPLSIGFCDIDHFKQVNDCHGHDAGDRVLRVVARKLQAVTDDRCHVARHGGEEFAVLFRGLTLHEAKARLDEAREELAARPLILRDTNVPIGTVTFSAGLASCPPGAPVSEVLRAADEALYCAKQTGRNRVALAP